jgi:membrane protein implicated in regulation of membrane protease activity
MSHEISWLILGVLGVIVEVVTGGFWMLLAGVAAFATALAAWLGLVQSFDAEVLFFVIVAALLFVFLRRPLLAHFDKPAVNISDPAGKVVTVVKEIPRGGSGTVEFQGSPWEAAAVSAVDIIPANSRVKIVRQENLKLWVERAE